MNKLIVVTGAAGFIGSALVARLNELGKDQLVLVDDFSKAEKVGNLINKKYKFKVHREQFKDWWENHKEEVGFVFHLGARTDTTIKDESAIKTLNIAYTKDLFEMCANQRVPLIYASSASTYGKGEQGYEDDEKIIDALCPTELYAKSKNEVDKWIITQNAQPPFWAGLKFFNVYGPNEYHKGYMSSVLFQAYKQILKNGKVELFKSTHPDYKDGEQMRDFIYIKDVVEIMIWMMENKPESGIYNIGTGEARTFKDLMNVLFTSINHKVNIEYVDMPESINYNYQYFTEADMDKLRSAGYDKPFRNIEDGVNDYVKNYLESGKHW